MKVFLLGMMLFISSCTDFSQNHHSDIRSSSIWNPLSYNWSAILPWNWFSSSSLMVNEKGLNGLNGQTILSEKTLRHALGSNYQIRSGMRTQNQDVVKFWQAIQKNQVAFEFIGNQTLASMEISSNSVIGPSGVQVGASFSATFAKAFPNCTRLILSGAVRCKAPHSQHIYYDYTGESQVSEDLLPPDSQLAHWKLAKIIWQK